MKKGIIVTTFIASVTLSITSFSKSTAKGVISDHDNFLGPITKLDTSRMLTNSFGTSLDLELGTRNVRINGTLGFGFGNDNNNLLKASAEYLTQDLDYTFYSGVTRKWLYQTDFGINYEFLFTNKNSIEASGYYSNAQSRNLSEISIINNGETDIYQRRIAGSNSYGFKLGTNINILKKTNIGLAANYDNVEYDTKYNHKNNEAKGLGGTLKINQEFDNNLSLKLETSYRQPFNYHEVGAYWAKYIKGDLIKIGIFGKYTDGKKRLENSSEIGINFSYLIDHSSNKKSNVANIQNSQQNLKKYIKTPAVYIPRILSIADEIQEMNIFTFEEILTVDNDGNVISGGHYEVQNPELKPFLLIRVTSNDTFDSAEYTYDPPGDEPVTLIRNNPPRTITLEDGFENVTSVDLEKIIPGTGVTTERPATTFISFSR